MRSYALFVIVVLLFVPLLTADTAKDDELFDQVRIQLANDREVGGGNIAVKVMDGAVELSGKVKSEKIRVKAEKIARKVKGVKSVNNRLKVEQR